MEEWHEEWQEYEEIQDESPDRWDEIPDENLEREVREAALEMEIDSLDVEWTEDIRSIEDLDLKEEEIEKAKEIEAEERYLENQCENGEITEEYYQGYRDFLDGEKRRAITRCVLKSHGFVSDPHGEVFDDWDYVEPGSERQMRKRGALRLVIDSIGPELVQDLADRFQREGRISENTHEAVSEQVELTSK